MVPEVTKGNHKKQKEDKGVLASGILESNTKQKPSKVHHTQTNTQKKVETQTQYFPTQNLSAEGCLDRLAPFSNWVWNLLKNGKMQTRNSSDKEPS